MPSQYQITLNPKYESCRGFCEAIDTHFDRHHESIHKARNEIKKIACDGYSFVVKSFKVPGFTNRLVYTYLRTSKAQKSYDNALRLQSLGINTPEPVAVIRELTPTLHKSYFISIAFEYEFTIREPLLNPDFEDREHLFGSFARFTADLHKKGVLHMDYSPGNILIKKTTDGFDFSIVDINRMHFKPVGFRSGCKNFSKLWADRDVLELIAREYANVLGYDIVETTKTIVDFDRKHKEFKLLKRKIKALF